MLTAEEKKAIISLIHKQVVPAIGCTEPIAVALCVAKTKELLGRVPETIDIQLSANILKNAMGVGIPGTGMTGLPIAVALGALIGRPELEGSAGLQQACRRTGKAIPCRKQAQHKAQRRRSRQAVHRGNSLR